jgi:hypothetical protein
MSHAHNRSISLHPLAIATVCLLGGFIGQAFAGQAYLAGLESAQTHQRFIVKYRNGTSERRSAAALERSLNRAASAVQVRDPSMRGGRARSACANCAAWRRGRTSLSPVTGLIAPVPHP